MAHTPSAKKRARQYLRQRASNRAATSVMKNRQKAFLEALEKKDKATIDKALRSYASHLDRSAKRGVIKKNQAIRKKTRAQAAARKALAAVAS